MHFEMLYAQGRSTLSTLVAILRTRRILEQTDIDEERGLFEGIIQRLKSTLASMEGQE